LGITSVLLTIVQLAHVGGVGGIVVVKHAVKGIKIPEKETKVSKLRFASDYEELMWLAEKQKGSLSEEEILRFYQLRDRWPVMHFDCLTGNNCSESETELT